MIPLFSTQVIRRIDEFAIKKLKIPGIVLMENASIEIFNFAKEKLTSINKHAKIGFLCGKGNNGGDGFAVARHFLNQGFPITVIYLFEEAEMTEDCKTNFTILKKMVSKAKNTEIIKYKGQRSLSKLKNCDMIIDSMLGSGIQGDLREPYQIIVKQVNKLKKLKLSIDIPTGLNADNGYSSMMFNADLTVTLGELKPGLFFGSGYRYSGEVKKGNIGIGFSYYPREETNDFLIEAKDALRSLPVKEKAIHKYSAGRVLSIAGSDKYSGAALLTSKAALKVGAGASILCFPDSIKSFVHKNLAEVVLNAYKDDDDGYLKTKNIIDLSERIKFADIIAIGPGLGRQLQTQKAVIKLLEEKRFKYIIIDADALFAISSKKYKKINLSNCILTPHHGEFCSLIGVSIEELKKDILKYGRRFVKSTGAYLVLKGAPTIIFLPSGKVLINSVGNPGMAKFGTGDVLTGVLAGFLSQVKNIEKALISGVYIHSLAADLLLKKYTELGFTASDLMNNIPFAIRHLRDTVV